MVGEAHLLPLTVQRYYALDFQSAHTQEALDSQEQTEIQALAVQQNR
jgi:hypothetical protein